MGPPVTAIGEMGVVELANDLTAHEDVDVHTRCAATRSIRVDVAEANRGGAVRDVQPDGCALTGV